MQNATTPASHPDRLPPTLPPQRRLHPLVGAAAAAVVIASLTAVAAVTGVLPFSKATQDEQASIPAAPVAMAPGSTTRPPAGYDNAQGGAVTQPPASAYAQQQPAYAQQQPAYAQQQPAYAQQQPAYAQQQPEPRPAPAQPSARQPQPAPSAYGNDGGQAGANAYAERPPAAKGSPHAGRVVSVTPVQAEKPTSGLGAVGGAVVGGLLGNQVGKGNGRILGTVVGAVGGGFAGNQIEKSVNKDTRYEVRVRMDDGSHRTFTYHSAPGVQPGERVHLENGVLVTG